MRIGLTINLDNDKQIKAMTETLEVARKALLEQADFRCIHDSHGEYYCDHCPAGMRAVGHAHSRLLCTKRKEYSK